MSDCLRKSESSETPESERLYRVVSPYFCAALVVRNSRVVAAAPVLEWALGWRWVDFYGFCAGKGWECRLVLTPVIEPVWLRAKRLMEEMG